MQFLTVRELSKSPKETLLALEKDGKAVLTNNGKPKALLLKVDPDSFEKTLSILQKLEFMQTLGDMRLTSLRNGNSAMSLDEINKEIKSARKEIKNKHV